MSGCRRKTDAEIILEEIHGLERERTLTDLSSRIATRRAGVLLNVEGAAT